VTRPTSTIHAKIFQLRNHPRGNTLSQTSAGDETPLRAELFSSLQMEEHGKTLAGLHTLSEDHVPARLLIRLAENENVLLDVRDLVIDVVKTNLRMTPAGEWLLDNFYLIEEQIRAAKRLLAERLRQGASPPEKRPIQGASPRV